MTQTAIDLLKDDHQKVKDLLEQLVDVVRGPSGVGGRISGQQPGR